MKSLDKTSCCRSNFSPHALGLHLALILSDYHVGVHEQHAVIESSTTQISSQQSAPLQLIGQLLVVHGPQDLLCDLLGPLTVVPLNH